MISLSQTFREDAEEIKQILIMFSSQDKKDAEVVNVGKRVKSPVVSVSRSIDPNSKESLLKSTLQSMNVFSSVDAVRVGMEIFYIRARRTVQEWVTDGVVRRIPDEEAEKRGLVVGGNQRIAWYEWGTYANLHEIGSNFVRNEG